MQPTPHNLSPDEAKAASGIATRISESLMPQAPQDPTQMAPESPGQGPQNALGAPESMEQPQDMDQFKQEIKNEISSEMSALRKDLISLLKEDEPKETKKAEKEPDDEITNLKKQIEEVLNSTD